MTDTRKVQLATEVDPTGAKAGFEQVKQAGRDMGQSVAQSAQQAAKGVDGIGAGSQASAQKIDRDTKSIIASIQRTTAVMEAGERGSARYFETLAQQRGVNVAALRPYLDQLEEAKKRQDAATASLRANAGAATAATTALERTGLSAKQTAAALRGVPAQFTDIATSIASGQAPLTVLLQQGGQLKDMFGGAGAAARALGGYVAGLITPVTLAVAAVAGLTYGLVAGGNEMREFQKAATLSGNAIGLSQSQFAAMAQSLEGIAGTRGKAAEALTEIAGNSRIAANQVRGIAEAALLMEKATGQAISKTVEDFARLAEDPAKAALELNKTYNFLTASIYEQIRALEEQGRKVQASELAMNALASTTKERASIVVDNAGYIEKAWRGVLGVLKQVVDTTANVGRAQTLAQQIAVVDGEIAAASGQDRNRRFRMPWDESLDALQARKLALESELRLTERNTQVQAEYLRNQVAGVAAVDGVTKANDRFLTKQQQINKALDEYRENIAKIRAANPESALLDPRAIARTEAGIRRGGSAETTGQSEVASVRAKILAEDQYIARLRAQIADPVANRDPKLSDAEKQVLKLQEELKTSITGLTRARKEEALAEMQSLVGKERLRESLERQAKAVLDAGAALDRQAEAAGRDADRIRDLVAAQEAANASFGKGKTAIEDDTLAALRRRYADAEGSDRFNPAYTAALRQQVEWQERYVTALRETDAKQISMANSEWARLVGEEAKTLQMEIGLLGLSQQQRETLIGQRKAELELAKRIAEIDRSSLLPERKAELRAEAEATALVAKNNAAQRAVVDEWQRTADSINNSLTDALLRGFEDGKDFARNFRDTLKNMFSTLVLRPVVQAVLSPVSAGLSGVMGGVGLGGQATSGINLASTGKSLYDMYTNGFNGLTAPGSYYYNFATSGVGQGMGLSNSAAIVGNNRSAYAPAGTQLTGGGGLGSLGYAAGSAATIATIAYVAIKMWQDSRGEERAGGRYDLTPGMGKGAQYTNGPNGSRGEGTDDLVIGLLNSTSDSLNAAFKSFGSNLSVSALTGAYETSPERGRGGVFSGGMLSNGTRFGEDGSGTNYDFGDDITKSKYEMWGAQYGEFGFGANQANIDQNGDPTKLAVDLQQSFIAAIQASAGLIPRLVKEKYQYEGNIQDGNSGGGDGATFYRGMIDATRLIRVFDQDMKDRVRELGLLPKRITDLILDVDPEALSAEATGALTTKIATLVTNVNGFRSIVDALPVQQLRAATFDIAAGIVELSGGLETFASNLTSYVENFYTEAEKRSATAANISRTLAGAGVELSADRLLGMSRAEFRALVEQFYAMGEGGSKAYAALLGVNQAFANLTVEAASAQQSAAEMARDARSATDDAMQALERVVAGQRRPLENARNAAQQLSNEIRGIFNLLQGEVQSLYAQVGSTAQAQAQRGQLFLGQALTTARATGSLPEAGELQDAIRSVRAGVDSTFYASQAEADYARLVLAGQLAELGEISDDQLSTAELQLRAAEAGLARLDDLVAGYREQIAVMREGTLSEVQAIDRLGAAIAAERASAPPPSGGGSGGGTGGVPASGGIVRNSDGTATAHFPGGGSHQVSGPDAYDLLVQTYPNLPRLMVGTNYVERAGLAYLDEGEAVVPKAYNPMLNSRGSEADRAAIRALQQKVRDLEERAEGGTVNYSKKTFEVLERVSQGGNSFKTTAL